MKVLITGGAGFIGVNIARHLLESDREAEVILLDNFSRHGVANNAFLLQKKFSDRRLTIAKGDIRKAESIQPHFTDVMVVYHVAAQVAVTTSVVNPILDFEINALGSLNVLEAARKCNSDPVVFYSSTNKVYGSLAEAGVIEKQTRYEFKQWKKGVDENFPPQPTTPYGVSKYVGDCYVRDYHATYGLSTIVFRLSCIYGPYQYGTEDQGWLAHFIASALLDREIKIYGTGKQVRDVLYIDDLLAAIDMAVKKNKTTEGQAYNIGGGSKNTLSLLECLETLEKKLGKKIATKYYDWRPADQKVYFSNIQKAMKDFGWQPKIHWKQGLSSLAAWCKEQLPAIREASNG